MKQRVKAVNYSHYDIRTVKIEFNSVWLAQEFFCSTLSWLYQIFYSNVKRYTHCVNTGHIVWKLKLFPHSKWRFPTSNRTCNILLWSMVITICPIACTFSSTLWSRTAKNPVVSTGWLTRPFTCLLALLTHWHGSHRLCTLLCSFIGSRSVANSLTPKLMGKWLIRCWSISLFWTIEQHDLIIAFLKSINGFFVQ